MVTGLLEMSLNGANKGSDSSRGFTIYNNASYTNNYSLVYFSMFNVRWDFSRKDQISNVECICELDIKSASYSPVSGLKKLKAVNLPDLRLGNSGNGSSLLSFFSNCSSLQVVDLSNQTIDYSTSCSLMFNLCKTLKKVKLFNTNKITNMQQMFTGCSCLEEITIEDASSVTSMKQMFNDCISLKKVLIKNVPSVTDMSQMFYNCNNLVDVADMETSSLTTANNMFYGCSSIQIPPYLDTHLVTDNIMGNSCYNFLIKIPAWDLSSVSVQLQWYTMGMIRTFDAFGMKKNLVLFSSFTNFTHFSKNEVVKIIKNLGVTTDATVTFGSSMLDQLTAAEKLIATKKGWTLA